MTKKRFTLGVDEQYGAILDDDKIMHKDEIVELLNTLYEEKEYLKTRFHEERELAMKLSRECDILTTTKQELELEIIRLEIIIRTGDDDDYNRTS